MTSLPPDPWVSVAITRISTRTAPAASRIRYRVRNGGSRRVWLVADDWFTWRQQEQAIEISLKRERLQAGGQVFGYFVPEVVPVDPAGQADRRLELSWPQRLSPLWNDGEVAAPAPGRYELSLVIGFGRSPAPPDPGSAAEVEQVVLDWQQEARSAPATLEIPVYDRTGLPGTGGTS